MRQQVIQERFACRLFVLIAALFLSCAQASSSQEAFVIGSLRIAPGQALSGLIEVPAKDDVGTSIPVTVIHGAKKGKTLAAVAGVHGYEYPPILALYRLKEMIDPRELAGTVIMVHVANVPAFLKRIIYYNPFDWKNLNRVFPGDPEGGFSQRLAHVLTRDIVNRCDRPAGM